MRAPLIIAVDGTAASGKGTISKKLAKHYGLDYMDTGTLYRGVAAICIRDFGDPNNEEFALKAANILSGNYPDSLEGLNLRSDAAGQGASIVGKMPAVRKCLFQAQRDFGLNAERGAVIDGRDIGTVIFPEAPIKLFFDADVEVRAERRHKDLVKAGEEIAFDTVLKEMRMRDKRDKGRETAPLKRADDAHYIDNTRLDIDTVFDRVLSLIDADMSIILDKKRIEA